MPPVTNLSRRLALTLSLSALMTAAPAVAVASASPAGAPAAHAAKRHKKKHKKKHKKHQASHHAAQPVQTSAPPAPAVTTPTVAQGPPPPPAPSGPSIPVGTYSCFKTSEVVSGIGAGFYSTWAPQLVLNADGTYGVVNLGGTTVTQHWIQEGDTISFISGSLTHYQATWYPAGVSMPHAGTNVPAGGYTLVLRDTLQEGGDPPSVEYSSSDGPGGGASVPMSFRYCKLP